MKCKLLKKMLLILTVSSSISTSYADGILEPSVSELWTGPYIGAYFGGGNGHFNTSFQSLTNSTNIQTNSLGVITSSTAVRLSATGSFHGQAKGSIADFMVGYNLHPREWMVTGAQLEGNIFNDIAAKSAGNQTNRVVSTTFVGTTLPSSATYISTLAVRRSLTSLLSVIWRGGVLVRPNALVYGLVGPTEGNFSIPDISNYELATTLKNIWKLGVSAGAGVEYKWTEHWSFLAEYRYLGFNNINTSGLTSSPSVTAGPSIVSTTNIVTNSSSSNFNMNIGKIGVVYRI